MFERLTSVQFQRWATVANTSPATRAKNERSKHFNNFKIVRFIYIFKTDYKQNEIKKAARLIAFFAHALVATAAAHLDCLNHFEQLADLRCVFSFATAQILLDERFECAGARIKRFGLDVGEFCGELRRCILNVGARLELFAFVEQREQRATRWQFAGRAECEPVEYCNSKIVEIFRFQALIAALPHLKSTFECARNKLRRTRSLRMCSGA